MGLMRQSLALMLPVLLLTLSAAPAQGQPAEQAPSPAAQLFDDGLEQMLTKNYDTACPMLAESYQLEPLAGVKFTLAECESQGGRLATALGHYRDYLELYEAMPPEKRVRQRGRNVHTATQIAALEQRVPMLELSLPSEAPPGTEVEYDGEPLPSTTLGVAHPFDPGPHRFTVKLPTGEARGQNVTLAEAERRQLVLELPASSGSGPEPEPDGDGTNLRTWAYVVGGVGAANLVVGLITGAVVLSDKSTIEDNCDDTACNTTGKETADSAQDVAMVSTVTFAIGLAGLAAGTVLWLVAPGEKEPAEAGWRPFVGGTPDAAAGAVAGVQCRW